MIDVNSANNEKRPIRARLNGDVAIIGMACMFPGAPDLATYWQNIMDKVDAITDPPPEAWDADIFFDPDSTANDRVYCKRGGYLGPLAEFNPLDYGIMPAGLDGGEPDQWLALKVAHDALADAGYLKRLKNNQAERHRTAVILGKGTYLNRGNLNMVQHSLVVDQTLQLLQTLHPEYSQADLDLLRQELKRDLPPFNAESAPGLVPNIVAGRIANRLDLMGPAYTIDAACASSLIALEAAMSDLLTGQCDLALAGGVQVTTPIPITTLFCQLNALSRRQEIRPFDKDADGTILGEGIGIIVLKRREDAEHDGDRIYALVKGVGTASDGRAMGVLAPRVEGAELALRRAYELTGISPETIELIEAHGTGTRAGDLMEVQVLQKVFGGRDGGLPYCALGSVKSMIGHSMPAAGIAGIIKTVLALYHKVLPPTLHCDRPNPKLQLDQTAFYINTETRPWIHGADTGRTPRRAGVNAFGFGGINAHVILEEKPDVDEVLAPSYLRQWDSEVVVVEADSRKQLIEQAQRLQTYLDSNPDVDLLDLAYTVNTELNDKTCRISLVADSPQDLRQKLAKAVQRLAESNCRLIKDVKGIYFFETPFYPAGKLAFLFPGEGSQYPNMLADLCFHFPEVRACFDRIDHIFVDHPRQYLPSDFIFPRPTFAGGEKKQLSQIDVAVEAVLTANQALFTLLSQLEIQPDAVVGHSTGEYSALRASGVIALNDDDFIGKHLLDLNRLYNEQVAQEIDVPRAMLLAVGTGLDRVSAIIEKVDGQIFIGMDNCPHQTVIVGEQSAMETASKLMRSQGLIYEVLPFDRAYHTPLFAAYSHTLHQFFDRLPLSSPKTGLYSCTTAAPYPNGVDEIRTLAIEHWISPVRFRETIQAMYADGIRLFVEIGARGNLTAFVDDILREQPHLAFPANVQHRSGLSQLNHLLGLLSAQGVPVRLDYLYQRRRPQKLSLESTEKDTGAQEKQAGTIKLATGWAGIKISHKVVTQLHQHVSPLALSDEGTRTPTSPSTMESRALPPLPAALEPQALTMHELPPGITSNRQRDGKEAAQGDGRGEQKQDAVPLSGQHLQDPRAQVMQAHLQLMEQFLDAQHAVMQQFLVNSTSFKKDLPLHLSSADASKAFEEAVPEHGASVPEREQLPSLPEIAETPHVTQSEPRTQSVAPNDMEPEQIQQMLLQLVSEKTGYPTDMLDLSANLEADLGIDSIKRVEILGVFNQKTGLLPPQDMEHTSTLTTLQQIIDFFVTQSQNNLEQGTALSSQKEQDALPGLDRKEANELGLPAMPFIRTISSLVPGQELVALCKLDLGEDIFLKDHTLGRSISLEDSNLLALPIVPLTISMEILAEAAAYLLPDQTLIGMREVRAHRWILLEEASTTLQVVATRRSAPNDQEVEVYLREADGEKSAKHKTPIIESTMIFGSTYPEPPHTNPDVPRIEQPSRWTRDQLYSEGMFHGPAFQAVASVDRSGEKGAIATLQALPTEQLFRSSPDPTFIAEPIILDAAGQLVGFWTMEHLETGFVVFPFRLESLSLYGSPLQAPEQAKCQARISLIEGSRVRSNIDIIGPDNRLRLRLVGWEDKRFDLPRRFYRLLLSPTKVTLSEPWATPLNAIREPEAVQCCRVTGFTAGFFEAHGQIWEKVLAHLVLSRTERQVWRRMRGPVKRRIEWLLGRVAAKDAIRLLVREAYGLTLCPADVEIIAAERDRGRPMVQGAWLEKLDQPIFVSLAHADGVAVAIAGQNGQKEQIDCLGIDLEHIKRQSQGFENIAFAPAERAILAEANRREDEAWPLRLWCAKEAVGKALGQGLSGGPLSVVAREIDVQTGIIRMKLAGEMARLFPEINSKSITAYTAREGDFVFASVFSKGG